MILLCGYLAFANSATGLIIRLAAHQPMLNVLKIKNLALVEDLTWELGPGLITVTGETGAGKSIIVGALNLILGERADRQLLRTGASHCTVEAVFALPNRDDINELLENAGLEPCDDDELVLKRVFSASGTNKQFINCSPATLKVLKTLGDLLVDLHGPHDHQSLLSRDRQLAMLDAYAGAQQLLDGYRENFGVWQEASRDYEALRDAEEASEQELELLKFQVEEIQGAELTPNEEASLEQDYSVASNSQSLIEHASAISNQLSEGPTAVLTQLAKIQKRVRELERIDDGVSELVGGFETTQVELEELSRGLEDYVASLEINPAEVKRLESRIDLIENLKRKYGPTLEDVIEHGKVSERKLNAIEGRGDELGRLEERVAEARESLDKAGSALSAKRGKLAPKLAAEVAGHLEDLGFKQSKFEITVEPHEIPHAAGLEGVDYQFAPNPGEPFKPLRVIASSGEMSRVMLAVKNALAEQDKIPLMVFDEIDANVGGEIATAVGRKMAALGERHQVVAITHMPQVAALSEYHYVVSKEVEDQKTRSTLIRVDGEARVDEVHRMLGGGGDTARALAESMLKKG
ncbi:MAG: DNA repair protein RecN (Recombination protein N) [Verrucomicrobiales bacterium]|jgi:DNA repair protein RecN (Recombination protein N)